MDLDAFVTLLRAVISPDTQMRKEAEKQIKEGKENQPARLIGLILTTLQSHPEEEVRLQAAVLLRSFFRGVIDSDTHVWKRLGDQERSQVKQSLIASVEAENNKLVRSNICDTISDLACDLIPAGQWDELGQVLLGMIQSGVGTRQQSGLRVLSEVAPVLTDQLGQAAPLVCRIIVTSMGLHQDVSTRVEAFALLVALVDDMNKKVYKKLIPAKSKGGAAAAACEFPPVQLLIIDTLEAALKKGSEDNYALADRMMALLIQLCEADHGGGVSLLRPHLPQFCDYMLALAFAGQGNTEAAQAAALVAQAATQASIAASTLAGANAAAPPTTECAAAEAAAATAQSAAEALEGLESCRKLAVEVLLCCVERKGQLMLHVSNFLKRLLQALLACMLDVRDSSYTKWLEEGEEDDDERRFFDVGEEGLDRLCRAYSSDEENPGSTAEEKSQATSVILPALFGYITTFLGHSEWEYRFVALMAISQTIEYVREDQDEELDYIARTLMRYLNDSDFRVRFAAAQAIGQMSLDQTPYIQEQFASEMLPLLIARMDDEVPRVQGHACAAFVNFTEDVEKPELLKVSDQVMQKLLIKIQPGTPPTVREHAVTCIAVVAGVLEESFLPYYPAVVPALLEIMRNTHLDEQRSLRGKAIECISIVGLSVGHDRFVEDGKLAMEAMLQISESTASTACSSVKEGDSSPGADSNCSSAHHHHSSSCCGGGSDGDTVREYLCEAFGRMCRVMGIDFIAYLPRILPPLLQVLTVKPKEMRAEEAEDDEDMTYVILDSNTSLGLKTSLLEEQGHALDLLCTITSVLQEPLAESTANLSKGGKASPSNVILSASTFLQPVAEAVLPLLSHILSDDLKQKALITMGSLIGAARHMYDTCLSGVQEYVTKQQAGGGVLTPEDMEAQKKLEETAQQARDFVRVMTLKTCSEIFKGLNNEEEDDAPDVESMIAEASGLGECLSKAGKDILTDEEVSEQALRVFAALEKSCERRIDISARKHRQDEEVDEDDLQLLEEEDQQEQTLRSALLEIVGTLMSTHGGGFLRGKAMEAAASFIQQFLKDDVSDEDKTIAIYVCDDILEHLKEGGLPLWPIFMPKLIECLLSQDCRVLQAAAFGIQRAILLQQAFQPFVESSAKNLLAAVNRNHKARNKHEQAATDNVTAALGDLLTHFGRLMNEKEQEILLQAWLGNLPLKQDETEGIRVHKQLLEAVVVHNNPIILGANNVNLPRVLQVLCSIYRTDFADDELNTEIKKLFTQINHSNQPAPLAALCQGFTPKEQKKLQKMLK